MDEFFDPTFSYAEEAKTWKRKYIAVVHELEKLKQILLKTTQTLEDMSIQHMMTCQERDEAIEQLNKYMNKSVPSTSNQLENSLVEINNVSPVITSSDCFLVDAPEFTNMNVSESNNLGYMNGPLVQGLSGTPFPVLPSCERPTIDPADAVILKLAKGKVLTQRGNFFQAIKRVPLVKDIFSTAISSNMTNPQLLQLLNVSNAQPFQAMSNPQPLQVVKAPNPQCLQAMNNAPLAIKDNVTTSPGMQLNPSPDTWNSYEPQPAFSPSMHNYAAITTPSWNHTVPSSSNATTANNFAPSSSQQRHQYFK